MDIGVILIIAISIYIAVCFGVIARRNGKNPWLYGILSVISPINLIILGIWAFGKKKEVSQSQLIMENELPEWETVEEETPPPHLEKKWEREEREETNLITCPACGKYNKNDALECIYCGNRLIIDSGFLGWISYLTTRSFFGFVLFVLFLIMLVALFVVF